MTMYEVAIHHYGRKLITSDCPAQGLLEWPQHKWARITPRPIGLKRAIALADAQDTHATVQVWMSGMPEDKKHDNGKPALVPAGWYPPEAQTAYSAQRTE
jgi:hypothetical protein